MTRSEKAAALTPRRPRREIRLFIRSNSFHPIRQLSAANVRKSASPICALVAEPPSSYQSSPDDDANRRATSPVRTARSPSASLARRATLPTRKPPVNKGRCGPCCSTAAIGRTTGVARGKPLTATQGSSASSKGFHLLHCVYRVYVYPACSPSGRSKLQNAASRRLDTTRNAIEYGTMSEINVPVPACLL